MESICQVLHALLLWFLFPGLGICRGDFLSLVTFRVVFPECTCEDALDHTTSQSAAEAVRDAERSISPSAFFPPKSFFFFRVRWLSSMLSVDFIFHPAAPTAASPTLSFGVLVNVIGDEAALPLRARHVLVIVALGVLGRGARVRHGRVRRGATVQFGDVAKGVRSLHGVRRHRPSHLWFWPAGMGLRLSPGWHGGKKIAVMATVNPRDHRMMGE